MKNEQSKETDNTDHTKRRQIKKKEKKHNMCCTPLYTDTNTDNVNKT